MEEFLRNLAYPKLPCLKYLNNFGIFKSLFNKMKLISGEENVPQLLIRMNKKERERIIYGKEEIENIWDNNKSNFSIAKCIHLDDCTVPLIRYVLLAYGALVSCFGRQFFIILLIMN